jgi:hypothetical protein
VAGARVLYLREATPRVDPRALAHGEHLLEVEDFLAEHGQAYSADGAGRVELPWPRGPSGLVLGRAGTRMGTIRMSAQGDGVRTLRLFERSLLRAQVRDAAGLPVAGVPVAVRIDWPAGRLAWDWAERTSAGPEGLVEFLGLPQFLSGRPQYAAKLRLAMATSAPVEIALDPDLWPAETLVLTLPAHGALELNVLDLDGSPFLAPARASLAARLPGAPGEPGAAFENPIASVASAEVRAGLARFASVEPGRELALRITARGSQAPSELLIPALAAGESRRVDVMLGASQVVLGLCALDELGRPLADLELRIRGFAHLESGSYFEENMTPVTDEQGCFRVWADSSWALALEARLYVESMPRQNSPLRVALVELARPPTRGWNDLGQAVLAPAPLLAAGRVLLGAAGITDRARLKIDLQPDDQASLGDRRRGAELERQSWFADPEGRFAIYELAPAPRLRMRAEVDDLKSDWVEFEPGAADLELVLPVPGAIAGSVRLGDPLPERALFVWIKDEAEKLVANRPVASSGEYEIRDLRPGVYEVIIDRSVLLDGHSLATAEGVVVRPGETTRDPRLAGIDLSERCRVLSLDIRVPSNAEPARGQIRWRPSGDALAAAEGLSFGPDWKPILVVQSFPVDVAVLAQGCRVQRLERVDSSPQTIELAPDLHIRLRLPSDVRLPDPPMFVTAVLETQDGWGLHGDPTEAGTFDAMHEAIVSAPDVGRLHVRLVLDLRVDGGRAWEYIRPSTEQVLEVTDFEGQVFDVRLTQLEMEEALQRLSR